MAPIPGRTWMMNSAITTPRLILRPPSPQDARLIFERYASDAEVTRFMGWPRHAKLDDTAAFLDFAASEWNKWPSGPLLIESRERGTLLGSTGLAFESSDRASTGYVLARDAWGYGYASEALAAIVDLARALRVARLYALCHATHFASARVLERCGFLHEVTLTKYQVFPNFGDATAQDVARYAYVDEKSKV
jgi:[ribosomal protein S5]-alanine N-acetyltransferase